MQFKSYSKINLGLNILNKRSDDFHNIQSLFIEIDFSDYISFIPNDKFDLKIIGNNKINPKKNTIIDAINGLSKISNLNLTHKIEINKNIPIGAGLGGGSSNAACVLKAINKIYKLNKSDQELKKIGLQIGSDVPFFINGGIQHVTGRGEILKSVKFGQIKNKKILLVFPPFSISTKWAYNNLKKTFANNSNSPKFRPLTKKVDWSLFENDFENVVKSTYPEILDIKNALLNNGAIYSGLSGSGSTMFGIYNDNESLLNAKKALSHYQTCATCPSNE
tara:strand:- start:50 stop:880 length:831 start_codon:yes stop_codon:yes gene_type:complete